jgi:hypothetical protein
MASNINLAALIAANSGAKGDNPAAIKSALTKNGQPASLGKNSRAKVVLPAPFGPAMITMRFWLDMVLVWAVALT